MTNSLWRLSRLRDIENKGTIPSIYRLYSLCAIYRLDLPEVLSWYGIPLDDNPGDADVIEHGRTHLVGFRPEDGQRQMPIALDPGLDLSRTAFLSRLIQQWGTVPLTILTTWICGTIAMDMIGTEDWSMFPLIPPGSLVVIDDSKRRDRHLGWTSEFERPIYFLEHREGYVCGWCSMRDGTLIVQPHPASNCDPESYAYPNEIEVVGQVTRVALSLETSTPPESFLSSSSRISISILKLPALGGAGGIRQLTDVAGAARAR